MGTQWGPIFPMGAIIFSYPFLKGKYPTQKSVDFCVACHGPLLCSCEVWHWLGPRYWGHLVWHQENNDFHETHQMRYFSVIYYLFINYIPILAIKSYRCCCKVYLYHFHIFQRIHLSNILFLWRSSFAWISTTWRARWSF